MKNWTKLLVVVLALAMVLSLAACGGNKPAETTKAPDGTTAPTTPEATPEDSTLESTPEASTPTESSTTPAESLTTPAESEPIISYNISYNLDGGYDGGNPTTYDKDSEFSLVVPVKPGYDFVGWTGTGLTEATASHKIEKGTTGDLTFTANWKGNDNTNSDSSAALDTTHFGKDDGVEPAESTPISTPDRYGARGEGIFTLKTIYTDITIDGTMDAAYTYGLRFKSDIADNEAFYENRNTEFNAYVIRGQDGRIYVYVDIIDPDVVVNEYIFKNDGKWRVDCLDIYYEFGNYGTVHYIYSFVPDMTGTLKRTMPKDYKIVLTDTGYAVEFAFDNGVPTRNYDEISIQFYLNDANNWDPATKKYDWTLMKHSSALNPIDKGYIFPNNNYGLHDAVQVTYDSASGKVDVGIDIPEKTGDMIADILSGAASAVIIYDQYSTAQVGVPARELVKMLSRSGSRVSIMVEETYDPSEHDYDYEILFGKTTRDESKALIDSLSAFGYGVSVHEDSICMAGWLEDSAAPAYSILLEMIDHVKNGGKTADLVGGVYTGEINGYVGGDIPMIDGYSSITDVGEKAWHVYKVDSTKAEYDAYIAKLEAAGYTKYTENVIDGKVYCATYTKGDTVVSTQWGGENDKSIRIVVEPLSNTALPSLEKPADANVTVPSVTLMYPHNLCMIFQLSNGHFIIVDSGNNNTQKGISDFLREKAPDGKPVVEAWIFTHFHQDHIGGFVDYMGVSSLTRYITVKSVIYNFPQDQVIQTAHKSSTDMNNMRLFYEKRKPAMEENGTVFYQARTGQKYYFAGAEIEILWTFEDIMPHNVYADRTNPTCIGFSVTIGGQKVMVTGDSSTEEFGMAANKYGDYLKSDIVQLSHHGSGDGKHIHDFYEKVAAPVVLWPRPSGESLGANEQRAVEFANANGGIVIRSGAYGITTLKLPFTVGDEFESKGVS